MQEKGRGFFWWTANLYSANGRTHRNAPIIFDAPWGTDGKVLFEQVSIFSSFAWIQSLQPGRDSQPVKMYPVEGQVILCYMLSGNCQLKCRLGKCQLVTGTWQLLPGDLLDIELQVIEPARLLWCTVSADHLRNYHLTFPDIVDWLLTPTFFSWYDLRTEDSLLQSVMDIAVAQLGRAGARMLSADEIWSINDRILLCAMANLSQHLYLAGRQELDDPSHPAQAALIRTVLLADLERITFPEVSQLSQRVGLSERSLQDAFKLHYGMSMFAYFTTARMEAIARQLSGTKKTLQQIGFEFRYRDYSGFSTAVSRWWGLPPNAIRKNARMPTKVTTGIGEFLMLRSD